MCIVVLHSPRLPLILLHRSPCAHAVGLQRFCIYRSEGFPNGIFHPCTLWDGGLARWTNCRRAVAVAVAVGVSCQNVTLISFSFRAWIGLIWEISGHLSDQYSWFFGARLFCKIPKSQDSMIYTMFSFFSGYIFPKWILSLCFSVTRPGRPSARPSARPPVMDHRLSNWFVFQYFSVQNCVKMVRVPVFLSSQLSQNGSCSSIYQFKTDYNGSCSNIFLIPNNSEWISK